MLAVGAGVGCGGSSRSAQAGQNRSTTTSTSTSAQASAGSSTPTTSTTTTPATTTSVPPTSVPSTTRSWAEALASVAVAEPSDRDSYDRKRFRHWIDADSNRCDTRCEVLLREFRSDLPQAPVGGWLSLYDGVTVSESSDLDVDHMVPLAEAWVSGAYRWDDQRREDFANDLTPGALLAVTASTNRSKSDRDPSEWLPPDRSSWCRYATDWVVTKYRWGLSVDPLEFTDLSQILQGCP